MDPIAPPLAVDFCSDALQGRVLSYPCFLDSIRDLGLLRDLSKALYVSAGAGHEIMALSESSVADVTGVELIDAPPLVSRIDPHNLPFFDGVFDLAFIWNLEGALFLLRFVAEMESMVRVGGACVVVVEECGDAEVEEVVCLFGKSRFARGKFLPPNVLSFEFASEGFCFGSSSSDSQ